MSVLIYDLYILGGASDPLCACCCAGSSCWCLILHSGVLTRISSHALERLYLPMFLFRRELLTLMYMDFSFCNTFAIQHTVHKDQFLHHSNTIDNAIKSTVEDTRQKGSIPFLDMLVTPENGILTTIVYRTPTHADQ